MAADGLPESAIVKLAYDKPGVPGGPGGGKEEFTVDVKPVGHGPLRLVAPDGRVDHFTRCWAELTVSDGRAGWGWIEWNHNQK
jgi:hypothetical protein